MEKFFLKGLSLLLVAVSCFFVPTAGGSTLEIIGRVEKVTIFPENISIKAKVDTGAKNSSLHFDDSTIYKKDGEEWVSFTLTNGKGQKAVIDRKVVRTSTIKRHFGMRQKRYVIKLAICLGDKTREVEVSLVNREGFNYQLLLGRSFLEGLYLVDVSQKYLIKRQCDAGKQ